MFESRYENELFLAEELMARGGALSPEDHAWLTKLIAAYEATSTTAPGDGSCAADRRPVAADTRPGIFETEPTAGAVVASESPAAMTMSSARQGSCGKRPRRLARTCAPNWQCSRGNGSGFDARHPTCAS
jgi:hypothetical protein